MDTSIYHHTNHSEGFSSASTADLALAVAEEARVFRSALLRGGYMPVPLLSGEKVPVEREWPIKARARVGLTEWLEPVAAGGSNTGIMCDGLYAVDVDVDDPDAADAVTAALLDTLGPSPAKRVRGHSARYVALYRAEGQPTKQKAGKVEILGFGQQCMVNGIHPDLEVVEWITPEGRSEDGLARVPREALPLVTADQINEFLGRCRVIFGIVDDKPEPAVVDPAASESREQGDHTDEDVADIIVHLPADSGYSEWVAVLSAIHNATDGRGRDLAHKYSSKSHAYCRRSVEEKWRTFRHGRALRHGFGYLLNRVREVEPTYLTPTVRAKLSSARRGFAPAPTGVTADQVIRDTDF